MEQIVIIGGTPLRGNITISGAKNAALPAIAASLLTDRPVLIRNVPALRDVRTFTALIEKLGGETSYQTSGLLQINCSKTDNQEAPYDLVKTMRASCMVMGPLLARFGRARVSLPGGCAIGERPINLHIKGFERLGAKITLEGGYVTAEAPGRLQGNRVYLDIPTVTGTMNIMMAAVLAQGETVLENAAREPEISDLANMLNRMGALIEGQGTDTIFIQGVSSLKGVDHTVIPDRIETGTFLIAGAITGGEVITKKCVPEHSEALIMKMAEAGVKIETGPDWIKVKRDSELRGVDIKTAPYPGFPTDMQAQIMSLLCYAEGMSVIGETVFENRFMHVSELRRMGAQIKIDGRSASVSGLPRLSGAPLMATDLRASASLVLAALAAEGESTISRVYHIDRGYEKIENKLSLLGADIRRIKMAENN
ncbi:MAG: UDP-N-acetylglucosamine 1-carboxyvinyltransferase [Nitrospinota bacterium]